MHFSAAISRSAPGHLPRRTGSQRTRPGPTPGFCKTATRILKEGGYRSGLGFDWALSKKDNLIGAVGFNSFGNSSSG